MDGAAKGKGHMVALKGKLAALKGKMFGAKRVWRERGREGRGVGQEGLKERRMWSQAKAWKAHPRYVSKHVIFR